MSKLHRQRTIQLLATLTTSLTTTVSWSQQDSAANPKAPPSSTAAPAETRPAPPTNTQPSNSAGTERATSATAADPAPAADGSQNDSSANAAATGYQANAPQAVAAPPAPQTPPAPLVAAAPTQTTTQHDATNSAPPTRLALGESGWVQVGALLQGWYDAQWNSSLAPGSSFHNTQSVFRMRRAELKLSGDIVRDVASFLVTFDPASTYKFSTTSYKVPSATAGGATQTVTTASPPGNTTSLKLLSVTLKSTYVEASLGQFKYPISYEGQASSAELAFPERAYSSRYFGDTYDTGVRLEKKFDWFKYQAFLLSGAGQNQLDKNLQKDLAVRLEFTPIVGITFGTAGISSIGQRTTQTTTKDVIELFGRLTKASFLIQGELLWGENGLTKSGVERTKAAGRYVILGYTIANKLQPVIRYGYLNTDKTITSNDKTTEALYSPFGIASDEVRSYEAGLNYFVQGNNLKLQAAYAYYDFDKKPFNQPVLQEFTFAAQAMF